VRRKNSSGPSKARNAAEGTPPIHVADSTGRKPAAALFSLGPPPVLPGDGPTMETSGG
jgi:hypothetical protein